MINDAWDAIFLGTFVFGLAFTAASLVFGDLGFDLGDGGDGEGGLPVDLSTILAFIAWFGGVGYLAKGAAGWSLALSIPVAVVGGLLGAAAVAWFMLRVVAPNDRAMDPRDYRLPGTIARVTSSIRGGGTGEIVYEQAGVRQVAAARAADGTAIDRGTEVVVLSTDRGTALVEPAARFFGDELPEGDTAPIHPVSSR